MALFDRRNPQIFRQLRVTGREPVLSLWYGRRQGNHRENCEDVSSGAGPPVVPPMAAVATATLVDDPTSQVTDEQAHLFPLFLRSQA